MNSPLHSSTAGAASRFAALLLCLGLSATNPAPPGWLVSSVHAQTRWAGFRGPAAGAVPDDPTLPDAWSETENVTWVADVPGLGWSSPIVWDDHVFLTTAISTGQERQPPPGLYDPGSDFGSTRSTAEHRWVVYDLDLATGAVRWERELHRGAPPITRHVKNSFASETPVTDGRRVYVYLGSLGLIAALDTGDGTVAWSRNLGAYNGWQTFGTAASPALHDGVLYLVNDNTTESFLVALDADTGDDVWRVTRDEVESWSSPFVWQNDLRTEIVTTSRRRIRSYGLDGTLLWHLEGMTVNVVPTPFASHGLVYVGSGYPGGMPRPVYAIRPGASGDISLEPAQTSNDYIVWYQPRLGTYNTSSLVYGDTYYTLLDRGFLLAHDALTGREIYGRQRVAPGTGFTASPWAYNDQVFLLGEDGDTYVVKAGPEFEVLRTNSLNEMSLATPAVADGSLLIRTQSRLYRIGAGAR